MELPDSDATFCRQVEDPVIQKPPSTQNFLMEQEVMSNTTEKRRSKRNRNEVTYFPKTCEVQKRKNDKTKDSVTQIPSSEPSTQDILMEQKDTGNQNLYSLLNAHIVKSLKSLKEKKLRLKHDLVRNFKSDGFEILSCEMGEEDKLQAEVEFNKLKDTNHFDFI
uniref:Uncharacterized protein n=1 Tax=Photinus pyralis TaxID=7054 RepID=A0A1Y1NKI5_PHOPY